MFPRPDGKPQRPRSAEHLRDDLDECGIDHEVNGEPLFFHDARGCVTTWLTNRHVSDMLIRRLLGQAPRGALEKNYLKRDDILEALLEAVKKIPLVWG